MQFLKKIPMPLKKLKKNLHLLSQAISGRLTHGQICTVHMALEKLGTKFIRYILLYLVAGIVLYFKVKFQKICLRRL